MPNRLSEATSPYLLQHADNPVEWWEWSDAAFAEAAARDVPVFLSVGYSACHWCHVMAHESFEDPGTAALMNRSFVNVKVDREERPDVDAIYMNAVQALTGHGGWPMSVWLAPDRRPFFAGTYFPGESRHGMRSFREVLAAVSDVWANRREEATRQAGRLTDAIGQALPTGDGEIDDERLRRAYEQVVAGADRTFGGFGSAPKFPQGPVLDFLLRVADRPWASEARPVLTEALDAMASGGLRDHVGGGFARYSVDRRWEIPHFEKMLYDNANLARLYLRSWQAGGPDHHRDVATSTLEYVLRDLALPAGGFASAEDADSEGEEGRFYTWALDEVRSLCGDDAPVAEGLWGITAAGNFEGRTHLRTVTSIAELADALGSEPEEVRAAAGRCLEALAAARAGRVRPGLDDKLVVGWNGLMIRALAESGAIGDEPRHLDAAERAARFVLSLADEDGRLPRTWAKGRAGPRGVLEDHASMAMACFALYQATGSFGWYDAAERLTRLIPTLFTTEGRLYATGSDVADLVVRPVDQMDNPSPSGSSLAVEALWTLGLYTGEADLFEAARRGIAEAAVLVDRHPTAVGHLLATAASLASAREVAVVGPEARSLAEPVRRALPFDAVLATSVDGNEPVPLLADRYLPGATRAFVCHHFACDLPVEAPEALAAQLGL